MSTTAEPWIYLTDPVMNSPAVRRWQEQLLALGFPLINGASGIFDAETDASTRLAQGMLGLDVDGIVGPNTLKAAAAKLAESTPEPAPKSLTLIDGVKVWDLREELPYPQRSYGLRSWDKICCAMLHRTAGNNGENVQHYVALNMNCHIVVTLGGQIILLHPWNLWLGHGGDPSPWSVGIEFDGNPEGIPGYFWRPGGGPHPITTEQVKASTVLLDLLRKGFSDEGQQIKYILAHRQSDESRECDPGLECWQKVAIPWMELTGAIPGPREGHPPTAGLKLPVGYAGDTWGGPPGVGGRQIATEWDQRSTVPFWNR